MRFGRRDSPPWAPHGAWGPPPRAACLPGPGGLRGWVLLAGARATAGPQSFSLLGLAAAAPPRLPFHRTTTISPPPQTTYSPSPSSTSRGIQLPEPPSVSTSSHSPPHSFTATEPITFRGQHQRESLRLALPTKKKKEGLLKKTLFLLFLSLFSPLLE